jgi:hypothetical protein
MIDNDGRTFVRGEGHADPTGLLVGTLAEAWGTWLQAWEVMAGMGAGGSGQHPRHGPKSLDLFGAGADLAGSEAKSQFSSAAKMADISPALAEACVVGVESAMRYWGALAELGIRYEAALAQSIADRTTGRSAASPMECRVIADDLRAFLRGVGDAASREARLLQRNLERVGETIAEAADQATPSPHPDEHRRRHEVKP